MNIFNISVTKKRTNLELDLNFDENVGSTQLGTENCVPECNPLDLGTENPAGGRLGGSAP